MEELLFFNLNSLSRIKCVTCHAGVLRASYPVAKLPRNCDVLRYAVISAGDLQFKPPNDRLQIGTPPQIAPTDGHFCLRFNFGIILHRRNIPNPTGISAGRHNNGHVARNNYGTYQHPNNHGLYIFIFSGGATRPAITALEMLARKMGDGANTQIPCVFGAVRQRNT